METTKQPVLAAGLLDSLINMFFKGLDKALTSAAEYEEEMGVLKQINRINLESLDGTEHYTLTIKLSPVKNKDNYYFVEAETDAPGLDVSSINEKTMKLDRSNMKQFSKMIDKLLQASNYSHDMVADDEEGNEEGSETAGEPADGQEGEGSSNLRLEAQVDELLEEVGTHFKEKPPITQSAATGLVDIAVEFGDASNPQQIATKFSILSDSAKVPAAGKYTLNALDEDGSVKSTDQFQGDVTQAIIDYVNDTGVPELSKNLQFGKVTRTETFSATFVKKEGIVSATSIKASTNIRSAIETVNTLVEDADFADALEEGVPKSFDIAEQDDSYAIEPVDSGCEGENAYQELFKLVSNCRNLLKAYTWLVGARTWFADSALCAIDYPLDGLVDQTASWVVKHCDIYPSPQAPFAELPTFCEFKDENGCVDFDKVKQEAFKVVEGLLDILDIYYPNLEHEEQLQLDNCINSIEEILIYV